MSAETCIVYNELCLEGKLCDVLISVDWIQYSSSCYTNHPLQLQSPFQAVLEIRGGEYKQYFLVAVTLP